MRLIGILAFFLLPVIGQQKVSRDISQEREAALGKILRRTFAARRLRWMMQLFAPTSRKLRLG